MRITRTQLIRIIREALETMDNPDITFRVGDVVESQDTDSGLWQIVAIEGTYARLKRIGSVLDGPVEDRKPLNRLVRSNKSA